MKEDIKNSLERKEVLQAVRENWKIKADTVSFSLGQCLNHVTAEDIFAVYTTDVCNLSLFFLPSVSAIIFP